MRILLVTSLVAVLVGAVVVVTNWSQPSSFGWTAYAPLSDASFGPFGSRLVSAWEVMGCAAMAAGVAGLAFWGGFTLGRRLPGVANQPAE
jgi:heme/copper-type cytochrome/quinol oxidase subunit 1